MKEMRTEPLPDVPLGARPVFEDRRRAVAAPREPLVTIGIPTFNRARFVRDAILSATHQTHTPLEVLVVDNASTDGTAEVVAALRGPSVRYVRNERNLGMTGNFNRVLELARGDYVVCLCDDDWLEPTFVEECLRLFQKHPDLGLVACPTIARDDRGKELWRYSLRGAEHLTSAEMWRRMARLQNEIGLPSSAMLSRKAIEATGKFDPSYPWLADWDYWIRVFDRFPIGYVPKHLANVRQHASSASVSCWDSTVPMRMALGTLKNAFSREACPLGPVARWRCAGRAGRGFLGDTVKAFLSLDARRGLGVARAMNEYFALPGLFAHFMLSLPVYVANGVWRRLRIWWGAPFVMP